ncbi:hypothetical protein MPDQ_002359 [Monascus purpureus]|uniref:BHLH domain-containing protein n=1 Tax=Monascus purpureus TaxID=5098 RepID=A0A507QNB9_MONPU|nr:hypothetical protein MPDQ_002359 [Monascus purpureus]
MEISPMKQPSSPSWKQSESESENLPERPPVQYYPIDTTALQWGSDTDFCLHGYSLPFGQCTEDWIIQDALQGMKYWLRNTEVVSLEATVDPEAEHEHSRGISPDWFSLSGEDQEEYDLQNLCSSSSVYWNAGDDTAHQCPNYEYSNRSPVRSRCLQRRGYSECPCEKEKRRRRIVRSWFDELRSLIPGLDDSRPCSRRDILKGAVIWIERLVSGNKDLHRQLEMIKASSEGNGIDKGAR